MSTVLITGASGFIGRALAPAMATHHQVLCMSRRDPGLGLPWIRGDFGAFSARGCSSMWRERAA